MYEALIIKYVIAPKGEQPIGGEPFDEADYSDAKAEAQQLADDEQRPYQVLMLEYTLDDGPQLIDDIKPEEDEVGHDETAHIRAALA